jgi:diphosphomevalonate decarboxylase
VKKSDVVQSILQDKLGEFPQHEAGSAFAPTNIALCKYWGKRNTELNLPVTSSLSIALSEKGAETTLSLHDAADDFILLNGKELSAESNFVTRLRHYLDLFRPKNNWHLHIDINMNIPVAAGLASSACGFASIILALDNLFGWNLLDRELSILSRLGSGSASRSLWTGFVEWHAGSRDDGMDSYAEPLSFVWPSLRVGILTLAATEKPISSRTAMQRTVETSVLYENWPEKVSRDMAAIKRALSEKDFTLLGKTSESNALNMHATMLSSWPPVCYFLPETIAAMQQIWKLREEGVEVYFTQDAGPNVKLLFLEEEIKRIREVFPMVEVVSVVGASRY